MAVRLITNFADLSPLEASWNALTGGLPMRSWDWLATWWKHYGGESLTAKVGDRQLYVLAVYDETGPDEGAENFIGLAPWYLDRAAIKGHVIRWIGSGEVCTDHLSLICRPEDGPRVAVAVAEALTMTCDDWDLLELGAVDDDDAAVNILLTELENRECLVSRQPADDCWTLELPTSWDDYLAAISKSHRKQLRQLERRVLESSRAAWHRVEAASDFDQAWDVLVDLHQRRRRSLGEPGCFASRPFHDFHREVACRLLARGQLRLSWLELDGTPAAAEYHVADRRTTYAYQGGVDPDRLAEEPGRLSTILSLRAAMEEGHRCFDFLRGDEPYKAHWRATPRATFDCRAIPNRRLARLRGRVLNLTGAVTDWMRQGASLLPTK
jgi:CelD/BcsL family acetyltransferase involved in cellulose biosynthesis